MRKDLAKLLDVSVSSIGKYENNKRSPDLIAVCKLANFFDVSVDYLIGNTDIKTKVDQLMGDKLNVGIGSPEIVTIIKILSKLSEDDVYETRKFLRCLENRKTE